MAKPKISKEDFYDEIKRIYSEHRKMNTIILKENCILNINTAYYSHKYHTLKNICNELNIPFTHDLSLDNELIKEDFIRVYKENKNNISKELYSKYGKYATSVIQNHFGGFNNLMKILNIKVNMTRMDSKEDVTNDLMAFYNTYNSTSSNLYRKHGVYAQSVIERIFGSWESMTTELGLPFVGTTYGKEYMLAELQRVYSKYGFVSKEIINNECEFTYQALIFYFGNKNGISTALNVKDAFLSGMSVNAQIINDYLIARFGEKNFIAEKTWKWLKNDKTNKNMYVDFYIKSINTALEYDGEQHFVQTKFFHRDQDAFINQQYRDKLKDELLKAHKIKIIRFNYKDEITLEFLTQILK